MTVHNIYPASSCFSSIHINFMAPLSSCRILFSPIFCPLHFHSSTQNLLHNNCRSKAAWFKSRYLSNVWAWWKSQRGSAFAFLEDQKWKITTCRQLLFLRPLRESVTMNSSCSFMCTNLYSCCFININICGKMGCFVYLYAHLFAGVWKNDIIQFNH